MKDIENRVRTIVVEHLEVNEKQVIEHAALVRDLGADSLDHVELAMIFEEEFGIEIHDHEGENIQTFGEVITLIQRKCQKQES